MPSNRNEAVTEYRPKRSYSIETDGNYESQIISNEFNGSSGADPNLGATIYSKAARSRSVSSSPYAHERSHKTQLPIVGFIMLHYSPQKSSITHQKQEKTHSKAKSNCNPGESAWTSNKSTRTNDDRERCLSASTGDLRPDEPDVPNSFQEEAESFTRINDGGRHHEKERFEGLTSHRVHYKSERSPSSTSHHVNYKSENYRSSSTSHNVDYKSDRSPSNSTSHHVHYKSERSPSSTSHHGHYKSERSHNKAHSHYKSERSASRTSSHYRSERSSSRTSSFFKRERSSTIGSANLPILGLLASGELSIQPDMIR